MIRGIYIGRYMISGAITMSIFMARAFDAVFDHPVLDFLVNPLVVFCLFITAAIIVFYPYLRGVKALIIIPIIVIGVGFFIWAYYLMG